MYEIDKTEDNHDAKGMAFLIHPKSKDCPTDFKTYSNRVIEMNGSKSTRENSGTVTNI